MEQSNIDYVSIGQRLKAFRIAASLRAEDIAKNLKISRAAVYRLEKGEIVKIETLDKLASLLETSMASLLGVDVEYYSSGEGFFERMRQLEEVATSIYSHFSPFSFLLTSPQYLNYLEIMLKESESELLCDSQYHKKIETVLTILKERKSSVKTEYSQVWNLIGLQHIEHFLHLGIVGHLNLPVEQKVVRIISAKQEVQYLINQFEEQNNTLQLSVVDGVMPSTTFQIFYKQQERLGVAVSPFRLGELPNVTNGIASVTSSYEAVKRYQKLFDKLWEQGKKGYEAIDLIKKMINKFN